ALHEGGVVGIHSGHENWDVVFVAKGRGRGDHWQLRSHALLQRPGRSALNGREYKVDLAQVEMTRIDDPAFREHLGERLLATPLQVSPVVRDRCAVGLSRTARAGCEGRHLEPRMSIEGHEELLAGNSGR